MRSLLQDTYEQFQLLPRVLTNTGQDCEAYRLRGSEQGWEIVSSMESKGRPGIGDMREESALNMFKQMDLKGKSKDDTQLKTVHQNTVATIRSFSEAGGAVKKFSCKSQSYIAWSLKLCFVEFLAFFFCFLRSLADST